MARRSRASQLLTSLIPVLNPAAARRARQSLLLAAFAGFAGFTGEQGTATGGVLVGGEFSYTVKRGDSLALVGARFGVEPRSLAQSNNLSPVAWLRIGQVLRVDNRHIIPFFLEQGILINFRKDCSSFFKRVALWPGIRQDSGVATGRRRPAGSRYGLCSDTRPGTYLFRYRKR